MRLQKQIGCFLKILYKSWESLVTLQLPSVCCVVFWTNESEKQVSNSFCTNLLKKERVSIYSKCHVPLTEEGNTLLIWKFHVTNEKKDAYISNETQLRNLSLIFIDKNKLLFSATSILSRSSIVYNTTASLDKLYRLCLIRQMPRQNWTFFLVQKWFRLLGYKTQSFSKR